MRRSGLWAMLAATTCMTAAPPVAAQEGSAAKEAPPGALYPPSPEAAVQGPLGEALGPARYLLRDVGVEETFATAVRRAVGRHPAFHLELSRRDEARSQLRAERAALYPRLSASVTGDYVIAREFGAGTDNVVESLQPERRLNAGLSVSQLLFDGGATFQRIKGAKALARQHDESISARVNELALAVLSAHVDLAAHQAIVALGEAFISRHEALLADVKERERLGAGSRADVMQAAARLAAAKARVAQIRESLRFAEIRYEEYFRQKPGLLTRASFDALAVDSREEAMRLAVERNPALAAAAANADRATAEYKAARAARLPEVRAVVNATKFDLIDGGDDYDVRAGVNLNYDIFAGGARGASIARAGAAARQQKYDQERVRQEIERDAAMAYERRAAAEERLAALADAVTANHQARALIAERFRVARGQLIDLLQAENDYFESGVAYLIGLADYDMATYEMMEHTGDLLRYFSPQDEYAAAAAVEAVQ
ncbi:TolC family protein [Amphiplicatus metriothermophilus]|uniref:Outer membrane protein, adhesin transport system n=1 Tax=Amphiplicatus metriothermophilus TaxID=1519374 RepID=A0A239PVB2_9PROT|nr:TolC family protein [Amphiplicatus metriothermophilus]MBB5519545.1 adhesin transport system outer membrane protein [Amphiplicatus metriothermophilus]SNT74110.1 outer membrane protein, adhesin transport system [Amphiplicatus metriothermophilus]